MPTAVFITPCEGSRRGAPSWAHLMLIPSRMLSGVRVLVQTTIQLLDAVCEVLTVWTPMCSRIQWRRPHRAAGDRGAIRSGRH
jgi:hypothetical protein